TFIASKMSSKHHFLTCVHESANYSKGFQILIKCLKTCLDHGQKWVKSMTYKHPQTYPFACPQAKQTGILSKGGLKIIWDSQFFNLLLSPLLCCNHIKYVLASE